MLIAGKRCITCHKIARFERLFNERGYDPKMGMFWCSYCQGHFYAILGNKEYINAKAKTLAH